MIKLTNKQDIEEVIEKKEAILLYFSGENCGVCDVLKVKIKNEISKEFPKMKLYEIETQKYKPIASSFSVFSIPTILVFFDSKEFVRVGRNISIANFIEDLKRPYNLFMD